ncbi:MAG: hypothetical protein C0P72_012325 [Clostridia bacterium]
MLDKYRELCNAYDIDGMIPTDTAVEVIDILEKDLRKAFDCVEANALAWEKGNPSVAEGMRLAVALIKEILGV